MSKPVPTKIKKLFECVRHFGENQKKIMKPIWEWCVDAHYRIKELEQRVRELEQPDLLAPPPDKYEGRSTTLKFDEPVEYCLATHCAQLLKEHGLEHKFTQNFIVRKNLTTEEFIRLAKEGKENGNCDKQQTDS